MLENPLLYVHVFPWFFVHFYVLYTLTVTRHYDCFWQSCSLWRGWERGALSRLSGDHYHFSMITWQCCSVMNKIADLVRQAFKLQRSTDSHQTIWTVYRTRKAVYRWPHKLTEANFLWPNYLPAELHIDQPCLLLFDHKHYPHQIYFMKMLPHFTTKTLL